MLATCQIRRGRGASHWRRATVGTPVRDRLEQLGTASIVGEERARPGVLGEPQARLSVTSVRIFASMSAAFTKNGVLTHWSVNSLASSE